MKKIITLVLGMMFIGAQLSYGAVNCKSQCMNVAGGGGQWGGAYAYNLCMNACRSDSQNSDSDNDEILMSGSVENYYCDSNNNDRTSCAYYICRHRWPPANCH